MDLQPSRVDFQALDALNDATDITHIPNSITALLDADTIRSSKADHDVYIPSKKWGFLVMKILYLNS